MIVELTVENLAIIERARLEFGSGFTVLTGETGAGKSLMIDAIDLALGGRADTDLVRTGANRATVAAVFDVSGRAEILELCADLGFPTEDGRLYIQREVLAEGRSQCRIGGRLAPASTLRQIGARLVDLHGQHDHQALLDPATHAKSLDEWIGPPAAEALERVRGVWERFESARRKLTAVRQSRRDREQRLDMLRFQIEEIEAVGPQPGEMDELESRLSRLKHAEKLTTAAASALDLVREGENPARDGLGEALRLLEGVERLDPEVGRVAEPLRSALAWTEEAAAAVATYLEGIEADPEELENVAARVDALKRLRRKYGDDESAVVQFLEKARAEWNDLTDAESTEESLLVELNALEKELETACSALGGIRRKGAEVFSKKVQSELRDLAMARAEFRVGFEPITPGPEGADRIEFLFTANLGEPPKSLARIASGGEISRVMLAIKTAASGRTGVPTLIFDEVDAGLGGRAAAVVAEKIQQLASHTQAIVISHLPQIASRATRHFHIEKVESKGRSATQVVELGGEDRVREVARMLAGAEISESSVANARDLLSGSR